MDSECKGGEIALERFHLNNKKKKYKNECISGLPLFYCVDNSGITVGLK